MKVVIIGTINKDLILPFHHAPIESFGGSFYDISVLSQLLHEEDEIIPVSFIGEDIEQTVRAVLGKLPNVSTEGLISLPVKNYKVILEYTAPEQRQEKSLFQFPSLEWEHIEKFTDADMIIVNMISGWDVEKEAFLRLSQLARERIYLDVHYLLMGVDELGRRFPQPKEGIEDWLGGARFVQMNQDEYELLAVNARNPINFYQQAFSPDQTLLITHANQGASIVYQRKGMNRRKLFPAYKVSRILDTTGCGDSFGAGFVMKYLTTNDISRSIKFANLVAAANVSLKGTNEMYRLSEMMDFVKDHNDILVEN